MTVLPQPGRDEIELAEIMRALSDPVRLELFRRLADGVERNCGQLDEGMERHKSTLSHHFRTMRAAGLTSARAEGRNKIMRLRREDLDARFPGLLDSLIRAAGSAG